MFPQPLDDAIAVDIGEQNVQHQQMRTEPACNLDGLDAGACAVERNSLRFQKGAKNPRGQIIILDDQDSRGLQHSAFLEHGREIVDSIQRSPEHRAALVMLDIDHFKLINDQNGHPVGDRVLATFAALLRRNLRSTDVLGRYGGDEFAFILNDLSQQDAERIVNRLREEFSTLVHRAETGRPFRATFSAGIAMGRSARSVDEWKKSADQALYSAKHAGRNQVKAA